VQEHERRLGELARDFLARRTGVAGAHEQFEAAAEWLSTGDRSAEDDYVNALERWLAMGGADFEARVESMWHELGLKSKVLDRPMTALSGGEAARVGLAALLLSRFDIYLLDEPTNDLDIEGLDRLESFVLSKPVGQLIVSHDREFLKRVVTRVVEIDEHTHRASSYFGGWSSYHTEKANARRHAEQSYATYAASRAQSEERARREREWMSQGVSRAKRRPSDNDAGRRQASRERSEGSGGAASRTQRALERLEVVEKPGKAGSYASRLRQGRNRYLAAAVQQWAFCSLRCSSWARDFYDLQRARGKTHHAALRSLGNRWLEILWHCLMRGQLYDEATHIANRNRAQGKAA